ncbi:MAG: RnfABCDGE type electron transport complex subunit G [Lachnospiraceae bacterium]|jgi:electron transport complex protein RnfG|nr:RnfABCDGE type electron transport complex subunit G [Lachnospiraceae bacterium]
MNKIIKNTLILTAITLASGLLLGFVHELTAAPIAEQEALAKAKAYAEVFPGAEDFQVMEDVSDAEALLIENGYEGMVINEVAEAMDASGTVIGHVVNITTPEGYGGNIQMTVGVQNDMTMLGISFLSISETAGLGMNADTADWKAQFAGIQAEEIIYTKSGKSAPNEIDAVSSATITTKAVTGAVNAALCVAGHYAK